MHSLPAIVLAFGLLVTALVCEDQRRRSAAADLRTETGIARDVGAVLRSRIEAKEALLSAVSGLFDASEWVTPLEYRRFFESLETADASLGTIQGLGVRLIPSEGQPFTTALLFMEPFEPPHAGAEAVDPYEDPTHREAMNRSAMTGEPAITAGVSTGVRSASPIPPPGGTTHVLYRAIFSQTPQRPRSMEARRRQLRGWAFMQLGMDRLIRNALTEIDNPHLQSSRVLIYEGPRPSGDALLFDNGKWNGTAPPQDLSYQQLRLASSDWLVGVQLEKRSAFIPRGFSEIGPVGLLGGTLSLLGALACRYLVNNHLAIAEALREAEQANRERALATAVFETSPLAILVTDPSGRIISTNNAFTELSGLSGTQARGKKANVLRSGRHDGEFYRRMWDDLLQRGRWNGEIWNRHHHDEIRRDELTIVAVLDAQQNVTHYVGMLQDITDRYAEQERVKYQAMHDYLTNLPNRALLMEQLTHHIAVARRYRSKVALMFIDLDGFKPVNDRYGHAVGDQLLQLVARRMQRVVRESDVLCRQGGDEYVLLVPEAPSHEKLLEIARKIRTAVALPYPELPDGLEVSVSIGIARWPEHGSDGDSLLDAADAAMYQAKHENPEHIAMAGPLERRGSG